MSSVKKLQLVSITAVSMLLIAGLVWTTHSLAWETEEEDNLGSARFTCRGSALRVDQLLGSIFEPVVANSPEDPCRTDSDVLLGVNNSVVDAGVLVANTEDSEAPVTAEGLAVGVDVLDDVVSAEVLEAEASVKEEGGQCVLTSSSSVTSAVVQGMPIDLIDDPVEISILGVGTLHFNATLRPSPDRVIQRALWLQITDPLVQETSGAEEVVVGEAIADFEGGNPCAGTLPSTDKRRMTGGGKFSDGQTTVTHGFVLRCDATRNPNNLQVKWRGNRFHLEELGSAICRDNPGINPGQPEAGFDTYEGQGTGRYNGVSGATAEWTFTDAGEPGDNDSATIRIEDHNGMVVLQVQRTTLFKGNHQAHGE